MKMSKFGGGIGAPSKEERLKAAAEIHLRLGQIQRYCELMVELGEVGWLFKIHHSGGFLVVHLNSHESITGLLLPITQCELSMLTQCHPKHVELFCVSGSL